MQSMVILAQDIPWVMAPASLIAAMAIISIIAAVMRFTHKASKVMMLGVSIAVTVGVMLMQVVQYPNPTPYSSEADLVHSLTSAPCFLPISSD